MQDSPRAAPFRWDVPGDDHEAEGGALPSGPLRPPAAASEPRKGATLQRRCHSDPNIAKENQMQQQSGKHMQPSNAACAQSGSGGGAGGKAAGQTSLLGATATRTLRRPPGLTPLLTDSPAATGSSHPAAPGRHGSGDLPWDGRRLAELDTCRPEVGQQGGRVWLPRVPNTGYLPLWSAVVQPCCYGPGAWEWVDRTTGGGLTDVGMLTWQTCLDPRSLSLSPHCPLPAPPCPQVSLGVLGSLILPPTAVLPAGPPRWGYGGSPGSPSASSAASPSKDSSPSRATGSATPATPGPGTGTTGGGGGSSGRNGRRKLSRALRQAGRWCAAHGAWPGVGGRAAAAPDGGSPERWVRLRVCAERLPPGCRPLLVAINPRSGPQVRSGGGGGRRAQERRGYRAMAMRSSAWCAGVLPTRLVCSSRKAFRYSANFHSWPTSAGSHTFAAAPSVHPPAPEPSRLERPSGDSCYSCCTHFR